MITKQQVKNCKHLIKLMDRIIDLKLPYSQKVFLQEVPYGETMISNFKELKKSGRTCCLVGYLNTTNKFKSSGSLEYDQYIGVDAQKIIEGGGNYTIQEAREWFIGELNKQCTWRMENGL